MHTTLWIIQALLAAAMLGAGLLKTVKSRAELAPPRGKMVWVNSFTDQQVRLIGLAEVVGVLGLILPGLLGILPILTPIAAVALVVLMTGAAVTHFKLREPAMAAPSLVLMALAIFVAVGRFSLAPLA